MSVKYWILGDVHGEFGHLMTLMRHIRKNGFSFKKGHRLVQLGDRCDRGADTFRVNNYFYKLEKRYPGQVICLKGNHEDMMIKAATGVDAYGFLYNGGPETMQSYGVKNANVGGMTDFGFRLRDCGHLNWLDAQPHFYETQDYLFTHAPIPYEGMGARRRNTNFRDSKEVCFWSYGGETLDDWVDPDPTTEGKISVHGHIHGITSWYDIDFTNNTRTVKVDIPGIRVIGNSYVIDSGSGCHPQGYLTCLQLPDMIAYTSKGEILDAIKEDSGKD